MSSKTRVFLSCHGSAIFSLLGEIDRNEDLLKDIKEWICFGTSALLILLKFNGYRSDEIYKILDSDSAEFIQNLIQGYCISVRNQEECKNYLKAFIKKYLRSFIDVNSLKAFEASTGCSLEIVAWNETEKKPCILTKNNFNGSVIDAICISLCSNSYCHRYTVGKDVYTDSTQIIHCVDVFKSENEKKDSETLCIVGKYTLHDDSDKFPNYLLQENLMTSFVNFNNIKLRDFMEDENQNVIIYDSIIYKVRLKNDAKRRLFEGKD